MQVNAERRNIKAKLSHIKNYFKLLGMQLLFRKAINLRERAFFLYISLKKEKNEKYRVGDEILRI